MYNYSKTANTYTDHLVMWIWLTARGVQMHLYVFVHAAISSETNSSQAVLHSDTTCNPDVKPATAVCSQEELTFPTSVAAPTTCTEIGTSEVTPFNINNLSEVDGMINNMNCLYSHFKRLYSLVYTHVHDVVCLYPCCVAVKYLAGCRPNKITDF